MHKISIFRAVLITLLLLLGGTGVVSAQGPVTTEFTYQGSLDDGGSPANGNYDFEFQLYNAASGGSPVGTVPVNDQTVTDGLFSVALDFGSVFDGTALWLEINVRPGASGGAYTVLDPRQPLTATPYALYALDGWGGSWSGTGTDTGLTLSGGQTGLNASGTLFGVYGVSDAFGVYGETFSNTGVGVRGYSNATTGVNYGVRGKTLSPSGFGVYGEATATSGTNYGVYGTSTGTNGVGVRGVSTGTGVAAFGVFGDSTSTSGRGVFGVAGANGINDTAIGVYGLSNSGKGRGVYGVATATSGTNYGVYGETKNTSWPSAGVYGLASATSSFSDAVGVYGETKAPDGFAGWFVGQVLVTGGRDMNLGGYGFLNDSTPTGIAGSQTWKYSIYAENPITALEFHAHSDARIKNIQEISDGAADLSTLSQIEITDYTYIDTITKGTGEQKKVIGQQVEAVYPQAVYRSTDVVPDIYQKAPIKDGWVMLATDLQPGERVRLISEENQRVYEVLEVTQDGFRTDFVADGDEVFVYGREVKDFRNVDYEAIAMLNVSATQELNRLVEQQAAELKAIKAEKEALNTRLAALEQAVSSIDAASQAESNSPLMPWLFGGLGIVGLAVVAQRRAGGK